MRRWPWRWGDAECELLSLVVLASAVALFAEARRSGMPRRVPPPLAVDPNTAPEFVLNALPRVGPVLAARIVKARAEQPFRTVDELDRVPRVGPATLGALRPWLRVENAGVPGRLAPPVAGGHARPRRAP